MSTFQPGPDLPPRQIDLDEFVELRAKWQEENVPKRKPLDPALRWGLAIVALLMLVTYFWPYVKPIVVFVSPLAIVAGLILLIARYGITKGPRS